MSISERESCAPSGKSSGSSPRATRIHLPGFACHHSRGRPHTTHASQLFSACHVCTGTVAGCTTLGRWTSERSRKKIWDPVEVEEEDSLSLLHGPEALKLVEFDPQAYKSLASEDYHKREANLFGPGLKGLKWTKVSLPSTSNFQARRQDTQITDQTSTVVFFWPKAYLLSMVAGNLCTVSHTTPQANRAVLPEAIQNPGPIQGGRRPKSLSVHPLTSLRSCHIIPGYRI